ncbi:arabinofuranosidase catalytic domain-containing protein [Ancylobacter sp. FA202]|uniref:arabinofuranosidase catalytic domain-containing protein n=1 Tax=Ancylobacter sp. FA202 TaxID=1111106 RepID=UPI00036B0192|nr:arabinofuranosidase catalytic domain-containing protein [Ancylobacter sp. FA202]
MASFAFALDLKRRGAGPATRPPLDAFAGQLYAAFGLSRLLTPYAGPCLRARRSGDGGEADIGFTASGALDMAAMLGFAGAGSAYATLWYDQTGNGRHATQAASAAQPRLMNAGVPDLGPTGRPTMVLSGAQYFDVQNSLGFLRNVETVTLASIARSSVNAVQVVAQPVLPVSPAVHAVLYYVNATTLGMQARSSTSNPLNASAIVVLPAGAWVRHIGRARFLAGAVDLLANGVSATAAMTPAQNTSDMDATTPLRFGTNATLSSFLTGATGGFVCARESLDLAALDAALAQVMP